MDTNVLLDILLPNEDFVERSGKALEAAATAGSLVICELVYAELCVAFDSQEQCDEFLSDIGIHTDPLDRPASFLASRVWRTYREQGGTRERILADFLIGAHAQVQASRLLTRDRGFYRKMFPSLNLLEPA
ncbi:MAG TPA: type II toxin-antitoxin system VapC family toxin [Terriglobales bacterium]|nr:type II toxin-antitoxin system VapC family toxin [Terriglobales bacterium]